VRGLSEVVNRPMAVGRYVTARIASACRTIVALLPPRSSHTRMACFVIEPKEGRYR
jgi:hypothetical protein